MSALEEVTAWKSLPTTCQAPGKGTEVGRDPDCPFSIQWSPTPSHLRAGNKRGNITAQQPLSHCSKADAGRLWRTFVHGHGESGERPSGLHPCPAGGTGRPGGLLRARPDFRHSPLPGASQLGPGTSHVPSPALQPAPGTTAGISHTERGKDRVLPQCLMPSTCKSCCERDKNMLNQT